MENIIKGLGHIGIIVNDMQKSQDFYKRLGFALDKQARRGEIKLAFLSAGTCLIELIEKPGETRPGRGQSVIDHIAIEVSCVETAVQHAIANGIDIDASAIMSIDILGGVKNVFFAGPDGEGLEFFEWIKN